MVGELTSSCRCSDVKYDPFLVMEDEDLVYGGAPIPDSTSVADPLTHCLPTSLGFTLSLFEYTE